MKEKVIHSILKKVQDGAIPKEEGIDLCFEIKEIEEADARTEGEKDIAVIGLAGRYPGARTIDEFWNNLKAGKDCVTEIPSDRWDVEAFYEPDMEKAAQLRKSYTKRGGFLKDVDKFDPLFFQISPREAEIMEPQERLFLETAWEAMEDAGYTRKMLGGDENKAGVYVGTTWQEYQLYSNTVDSEYDTAFTTNSNSIANRFSYFCGLRGASMAVDTACSSALTAVHLACQSLRHGENTIAVAGGVNLSLHPNKYTALSSHKFISPTGVCRSFGEGADGYVPGEGVGCVILKPLKKAVYDHDHIYGIIKGTAVNHGGRTNGYTVPAPDAQAEVIGEAIKDAGISARQISYVEAHGTGTALGDPIELDGLEKAFRQDTKAKQFCRIGSVKSNIGHCEAASGMASLTKVLMQFQHKQLVSSLHSETLNRNLSFSGTPFCIQRSCESWKRPVVISNGEEKEYPRTAGISSFGAGGSNAHLIVQEYEEPEKEQVKGLETAVIMLSARNQETLKQRAGQLINALEQEERKSLRDIAYTLQTGREAMEERMAFTAVDRIELKKKLFEFINGTGKVVCGRVQRGKHHHAPAVSSQELEALIQHKQYEKIAELWVKGAEISWEVLYPEGQPYRISLPAYPFEQIRCWVSKKGQQSSEELREDIGIEQTEAEELDAVSLKKKVITFLKQAAAPIIKLPPEKIEESETLDAYGIDSIMIEELTKELEKHFGTLSKTLFFEYQSIEELAEYFQKEYRTYFAGDVQQKVNLVRKEKTKKTLSTSITPAISDIAVVGISGRYPGARNVMEFWNILKEGMDCITEVPADRWDASLYYDPDKEKPGKTYAKWGGFIDGVDEFDPMFFGIMPKEAEEMDPQERLFLQCAYETIEDAGYTPESLSAGRDYSQKDVGVFAGVTSEEYQFFGVEKQLKGQPMALVGSPATIANRVSYCFNFHGPSMSIDTMCSSSLTAIKLACTSIQNGSCKAAIAGGVNVSIHPNKYFLLGEKKFASSNGRCLSFGSGGDGYVPGEGVGAVLLKPLADAEADGDHIYGIIKAATLNHGGKTNGYTVPNPNAQAAVIREALEAAHVDAGSISYIEAHGTGTSLGDPIEITGLVKAFSQDTQEKQYCSIGSAKSNIGHLESAAGIAGLTKVLLQMEFKQMVPSLHSEVLNPNINFKDSPFFVQQKQEPWNRPIIVENGQKKEQPRIAGVSSFGAGGTNAHIIVEEYEDNRKSDTALFKEKQVLILSAQTKEQLKEMAQRLVSALEENRYQPDDLAKIAYTLQTGKRVFACRLAAVAGDIQQWKKMLQKFLAGEREIENLFIDDRKKSKESLAVFQTEEWKQKASAWMQEGNLTKIADFWVRGLEIDWNTLYKQKNPGRISLPTYPFLREHYWITETSDDKTDLLTRKGGKWIHPFLQENCSDFYGQKFRSIFSGEEPFFIAAGMNQESMLPSSVYMEMVRAAIETSLGSSALGQISFYEMAWNDGFQVKEKKELYVHLVPENETNIEFEVTTAEETEVICSGRAVLEEKPEDVTMYKEMLAQCKETQYTKEQCYHMLSENEAETQDIYKVIESVSMGNGKATAVLKNPGLLCGSEEVVLNPAMMEGMVELAELLWKDRAEGAVLSVAQIKAFHMYAPCTETMRAVVWLEEEKMLFSGCLIQEDGTLAADFTEVLLKENRTNSKVLLLEPEWKEQKITNSGAPVPYEKNIVALFEGNEEVKKAVEQEMKEAEVVVYHAEERKNAVEKFLFETEAFFEKIQALLKEKPRHKVRIQVVVPWEQEEQVFAAVHGLLKTASIENPAILGQVIRIAQTEDIKADAESIADIVKKELNAVLDVDVAYIQKKRMVKKNRELVPSKKLEIPWKQKGVYLITGGTGGLGFLFAEDIAKKTEDAAILLTGRKPLSIEKQEYIKKLESYGTHIRYLQANVTDAGEVANLFQEVRTTYGKLNGILHCAGVIKDNFIIKKTKEELENVMAAKTLGITNLDVESKEFDLDFFVAFSSVAGCTGNYGQADYAMANAYMDAYVRYRTQLTKKGLRKGRTLSVNWSLWRDGGMKVDPESRKQMYDEMGIVLLETKKGLNGFYQALSSEAVQVMVLQGNMERMSQKFLESADTERQQEDANSITEEMQEEVPEGLYEKTLDQTKLLLSRLTKINAEKIDEEEAFETYGIDSVMITKMNQELSQVFGQLSKTLLFEYQNLKDLTGYLVSTYPKKCSCWSGMQDELLKKQPEANKKLKNKELHMPLTKKFAPRLQLSQRTGEVLQNEPIAIIGVSGQYPGARNVKEYWKNLSSGKNSVSKIPEERWTMDGFYCPDREEARKAGMSYSRWGGFLKDFDQFDPLFFHISPAEAQQIDPQERLFLQTVYEAFEDAGYTKTKLAKETNGRIGVFAGITKDGFALHGPEMAEQKQYPYTSFASVANRISYLMDFHGPSVAVDTMCSSSLTAVHEACNHIHLGECDMAVAGGVNLYLHPMNYIHLCLNNMLSDDGLCRSYGKGGSGFVPGEGVGAIILKPLSKAERDKDHIYGVVKGSQINHGGKTNGYTVPNPNAIAELVKKTIVKSGVNPRAIGYVEGHGTGTALGDPIEINALSKAFGSFTKDRQFCSIGSSKSNIGHAESAAGIAGLTKVLMQMKHKKLVPSLHSDELNENIDFIDTPFFVQHIYEDWEKPVIEENHIRKEYPRTAAVSSLGAGGVNAHIIIEEYENKTKEKFLTTKGAPELVVLSAKNETVLKQYAKNLMEAIREDKLDDDSLAEAAYTLQTGREPMEERLALLVDSMEQLYQALASYVEGVPDKTICYQGNKKKDSNAIALFRNDEDFKAALAQWMQKKKYGKLAELWVKGLDMDWEQMYGFNHPYKISLPVYPFEKQSFWLKPKKQKRLDAPDTKRSKETQEPTTSVQKEETKEQITRQVWKKVLGVKEINPEDSFRAMGGDSIKALSVVSLLKEAGYQIPVDEVLELDTLEAVSQALMENKKKAGQDIVEGEIRLLPVQSCFFERNYAEMHCWDTCIIISSSEVLKKEFVEKVFIKIAEHHDALRIIFQKKDNQYIQINRGVSGKLFDFEVFDFRQQKNYEAKIEKEKTRLEYNIDLEQGPLMKLALFHTPGGDRLLVIIHHLICDFISTTIICQDMVALYEQLKAGKSLTLPQKTNSFMDWSKGLYAYGTGEGIQEELDYWMQLDKEACQVEELPKDYKVESKEYQYADSVDKKIGKDTTLVLLNAMKSSDTFDMQELLVSGLSMAVDAWCGNEKTLLYMARNGRDWTVDELDISRTVGWLSISYPVLIDITNKKEMRERLETAKAALENVPDKGAGYDIIRYITLPERKTEEAFHAKPEIFFNYVGNVDGSESRSIDHWNFRSEDVRSQKADLVYSFDIRIMIVNNEILIKFIFSSKEYEKQTVEELGRIYTEKLEEIARYIEETRE